MPPLCGWKNARLRKATASVIGSQPPGSAGTTTLAGLASPGNVASFKVFVVLTTGNEAGSNTVTITRMS